MTPAINVAKKAKVKFNVHEYQHDPNVASYGDEAAQAIGVDPARVFKTLLVSVNGNANKLAVGVVPVAGQLDLKAMAMALNAKKVVMANPEDAERATGYIVGGISPLGQKKRLPLVLDESAKQFETIFMSAGRRGLEIEMSYLDLLSLTNGQMSAVAKIKL